MAHSQSATVRKFYRDAGSLAEIVCAFLGEGLKQSEPAVLIATPEHVQYVRDCVSSKGIDGVPMPQPFAETMAPILTSVAARHPGVSIRAYGEMVDDICSLHSHVVTEAGTHVPLLS